MAEVLIISGAGCYSDPWHPFADTSRSLANIISGLGHDVTLRKPWSKLWPTRASRP
jgi:hypothetical protein